MMIVAGEAAVMVVMAGEPYRGNTQRPRIPEQVSAVAVLSVTTVEGVQFSNFRSRG